MDSAIYKREYRVERALARRIHAKAPAIVVADDRKRLASHRIAFLGHAVAWSTVTVFLLVVAGLEAALIVGLAWGIGLAVHGFFGVAAPILRRRWMDAESSSGSNRDASRERIEESRLSESRNRRSLEELSASIAHEIRNPITAAKSLVQQIAADPASPDSPEYARIALEELARVERSVSHLLRYARDEELTLADVDIFDVASSALDLLSDRIATQKARIERDLEHGSILRGDKEKLRRVVTNLVENALDALADSTQADPFVIVSCGHSLSGNEVWLRIKDNGPGIAADRLAKIWAPFFTTKSKGTGLGLAITKKLVEAHGGRVEATTELNVGTEIVATFPSIGGSA